MMGKFMNLDQMVEWMRASGVSRANIHIVHDVEESYIAPADITLDPDWRPAPEVEDTPEDPDAEKRRAEAAARRPFRHVRF